MYKRRGKLYVISGPSGVGKGTLVQHMLKKRPAHLSISCTSRKPRVGEVEGESYFFISEEDFLQKIKEGAFLEWAKVYGNYYGTPRASIEEKLSQGIDVILEIEMLGSLQIRKGDPHAISIFVMPPSLDVLRQRLASRGTESQEAMEERLSCTMEELEHLSHYNYYLLNQDLERATDALLSIMDAESLKVDSAFLDYMKETGREFEL